MRPKTRVAMLCAGLLLSHQAAAADLPQRWVSALQAALKTLSDGFYPAKGGQ